MEQRMGNCYYGAEKRTAVCARLALSTIIILSLVLFLSTEANAAYAWTSTGSPSSPDNSVIRCLAMDETHDILYAGADNGQVYRYQDGAWTSTDGPSDQSINDIEYDPVSKTVVAGLYNGVTSSFEVWTFREGGAWVKTKGAVGNFNPNSVASDGARKKLYAGAYGGETWVYDYKSAPGPWAGIGTPMDGLMCLELDPGRNVLYAGGFTGTEWPMKAAVYRYDGSNWSPFGKEFGAGISVSLLVLDSARNVLYAGIYTNALGEVNVFRRNIDAGGDWVGIGTLCGGPDIYGLTVDEANDTLYALAFDGHAYKNCNASVGSTWIDIGLVSQNTVWNQALQYDVGGSALFCGSSDGQVYRQGIPAVTALEPPSGARGQTLDVEITATGGAFTADSRAVFSGDGVNVNSTSRLSPTKVRANISIEPETYVGPRIVWVKTGGDKTNRLVDGFTVTEAPVLSTWYLAEGTTAWGFDTYITVENPNDEELTARFTYMDPNTKNGAGEIATRDVNLPSLSQTTVDPRLDLGDVDFSTRVECLECREIAVDRTMYWTGEGTASREAHNSIGTTEPSKTWYLPEGSSRWGFETWTLIQNPNNGEATVTLTYMTEDAGPLVFQKIVPAHARATFSMADDIGSRDSSIEVTSDLPVIAERSQYRDNRRGGSCSIGATTPATDYFLAEGTTAWGFETFVLVQNPNNSDTAVTLTYMTPDGPVEQPSFSMEPNSRRTVKVNDVSPANGYSIDVSSTDLSTLVESDKPVIAERAMYWNNGTGQACHDSIGLDSPHMTFYLPDGQTTGDWETWTLVANPNPSPVTVEITYLPENEGTPVTFTDEIAAGSRRSYNMAGEGDSYPGFKGRASIVVKSLDGARPVMAERAMYMNSRGGGTATVGSYSD